MADLDISRYVLQSETSVCLLECTKAFNALSSQEKFYAHYLSQASWAGSLICLIQTSPEAPRIYLLLIKLFRAQPIAELEKTAINECQFTRQDFHAFLVYSAAFLSNMGNYKSFGDTKFIPDLPKEKMNLLIHNSQAYRNDSKLIQHLWDTASDRMYSLTPRERQLELGQKGISTYFSLNCDVRDAEIAQEFMNSKDLSGYNTRLFKCTEDGKPIYEIRLASSLTSGDSAMSVLGVHEFMSKTSSTPVTVKVARGDYAPLMQLLVDNLNKAKEYASNATEVKMLECYVESFTQGSIPAHKDGSRYWIRNKGPIIETYIGFIESYRDPFGVRGEFEGFVAMVNKDMSAKLGVLVSKAEHFLPLLPWPAAYEKDEFQKPDFTSLDVLTFASSGIPAGINIPNYDDIRQDEGFKNVSLGNVLSAGYKEQKVTFLDESDVELYNRLKITSFEVQVGLHELLGHGSGKLFQKDALGVLNFNTENVKHIETGEKISTWYEHGETWSSKFQSLAASYEECRAECVGIYLCLSSEILSVFGHEGAEADDIIYINWLNMVRAGLLALEFYSPETHTWGQAHMQARYVILRVLLRTDEDLVTIEKTVGTDGQPDLLIKLNRSKINSVGKAAIGEFLQKLQLYKATADYNAGKDMFERYSDVNDHEEPHFLSLRNIVLKRKQPRKMFVQCNTNIHDDVVVLREYESSPSGLIQSFVDRYHDIHTDDVIQQLATNDEKHFIERC